MKSNKLSLYIDYASQPSRAIIAFCNINSIPHEVKEIRISKGQHREAEFLQINPNGYLPAIDDAGFKLSESHAILRYLAQTRRVASHWYPHDLQQRAIVD